MAQRLPPAPNGAVTVVSVSPVAEKKSDEVEEAAGVARADVREM